MIPMPTWTALSHQEQLDYESSLKSRLQELKRLQVAINEEHTAKEMELLVITWRKAAGKPAVKKVVLYEDFFKKVKRAPRQDKVGKQSISLEEAKLLASLEL